MPGTIAELLTEPQQAAVVLVAASPAPGDDDGDEGGRGRGPDDGDAERSLLPEPPELELSEGLLRIGGESFVYPHAELSDTQPPDSLT